MEFKKILIPPFLIMALLFVLAQFPPSFNTKPSKTISSDTPTPSAIPSPTALSIPTSHLLQTDYHVFQTFNNCGPASLSMTLRFYGINTSQQTLGNKLRPFQNAAGDNDDKSVTLAELGNVAKEYGLNPIYRPLGDINILKAFISQGFPVITRTWLKADDDIGHFRVVKGFNDSNQTLIQDDSYQNKNLEYSYSDFLNLWQKFNYEYLVLVPVNKQYLVKQILGSLEDENVAWQAAADRALLDLITNPNDITTRFNLSVAFYHLGLFKDSVAEFEKIQADLPTHILWYQIEPILSYYQLGQYQKALSLTETILNNHNRAFSELYLIRSQIYKRQGNFTASQNEYQLAEKFNKNLSGVLINLPASFSQ